MQGAAGDARAHHSHVQGSCHARNVNISAEFMSKPKSNPPIHSSGRRPLDSIDSLHPSSLPPELGSLDMAWDDDPSSVASIDLLQNSDLMDIEADANERTTAVPDIPMDQLV